MKITKDDARRILGVREESSPDEIRSSYKRLALKWHPDKHGDSHVTKDEATKRFQEVSAAYKRLTTNANDHDDEIDDSEFMNIREMMELFAHIFFHNGVRGCPHHGMDCCDYEDDDYFYSDDEYYDYSEEESEDEFLDTIAHRLRNKYEARKYMSKDTMQTQRRVTEEEALRNAKELIEEEELEKKREEKKKAKRRKKKEKKKMREKEKKDSEITDEDKISMQKDKVKDTRDTVLKNGNTKDHHIEKQVTVDEPPNNAKENNKKKNKQNNIKSDNKENNKKDDIKNKSSTNNPKNTDSDGDDDGIDTNSAFFARAASKAPPPATQQNGGIHISSTNNIDTSKDKDQNKKKKSTQNTMTTINNTQNNKKSKKQQQQQPVIPKKQNKKNNVTVVPIQKENNISQESSSDNNIEKSKNQQNLEDTMSQPNDTTLHPVNSSTNGEIDTIILQSRQVAVLGNKLAQTGDYHGAVDMFTKAIKLDPSDFRFFGNRSYCYDRIEKYENALKDADAAIVLAAEWPKGYFRKGRALTGLKRFQEAEQVFQQVLKLDPVCEDAQFELARVRVQILMDMGFMQALSEQAVRTYGTVQQALEALLAGKVSDEEYSDDESLQEATPPQSIENNNKKKQAQKTKSSEPKCTALWVGNVDPEMVTEKHMTQLFSKCGKVSSVRILPHKYCAFVNYVDASSAAMAMEKIQGAALGNQKLLLRFPNNPPPGSYVPEVPPTAVQQNITNTTVKAKTSPIVETAASLDSKISGPVNGNECYFWRTTGCAFENQCRYKHVRGHKGIDLSKVQAKYGKIPTN